MHKVRCNRALRVCRHEGCRSPQCWTFDALRFLKHAQSVAPCLQQTVRWKGIWPASQAVLGCCLMVSQRLKMLLLYTWKTSSVLY